MSTFVAVGNAKQPFQRLLDAVGACAAQLPQPVVVQYGYGRFNLPGCDARAFIPMGEYERLTETADLVILQAGGGGVLQAIRAGKIPVIMPRRRMFGEIIDDHQVENAEALSRVGKAVVVHDGAQLLAAVHRALELQRKYAAERREPQLLRLIAETLQRYAQMRR